MTTARRLEVVPTAGLPEPPYPADTRAKGWKFELEYERIEQSTTWKLASAELRPWLLMLWFKAWSEWPAGSLPDDDEVIAVTIGMPLTMFQTHRAALMRGWTRHADGRLYHATLSERVLDMIARRTKEAARQGNYRAHKKQEVSESVRGSNNPVTRDNTVSTTPEPVPEPQSKDPPVPPKGGKRRSRVASGTITFDEFQSRCKATGEKRIAPDDPIHTWAAEVKLPAEYLRYAWVAFRDEYRGNPKRYKDWRQVFRTSCRRRWFKLWYYDQQANAWALTSDGHAIRVKVESEDAREAARA